MRRATKLGEIAHVRWPFPYIVAQPVPNAAPAAPAPNRNAPIPAKAGTMPAHDGLGPDDRDDLEDRRKPTIELDQE
jgi:hypothetical protein